MNYYEERTNAVKVKLEERDKLGKKMVALTDVERKCKDDIHGTQRYIAKLEIKNNLLRKEIHNSQFERIKLLKQVNEIKNKIDEVTWFAESMRKAVYQVNDPGSSKAKAGPETKKEFKIPSSINSELGYKKCLLAESTLQSKQLRENRVKNFGGNFYDEETLKKSILQRGGNNKLAMLVSDSKAY